MIDEKLLNNNVKIINTIKNGMVISSTLLQKIGSLILSEKVIILILDCCGDGHGRAWF